MFTPAPSGIGRWVKNALGIRFKVRHVGYGAGVERTVKMWEVFPNTDG